MRNRFLSAAATAAVSVALGLVIALSSPAPARAGAGSGSFGIAVHVVVKGGPGDPVPSGGITVTVPPKCWWVPFNTANLSYYDIDPSAPDAMTQWVEATRKATSITFVPSLLTLPTQEYMHAHEGTQYTWYTLGSADGVNCSDEGFTPSGGSSPGDWGVPGSGNFSISLAAFIGADPAPPLVDVEDVVREVWDAASAQIEGPQLVRNPELGDFGGATMVNLPTWFWVENTEDALAGDGKIHLEVSIPGTPVRATLDAATDGVQVTSPAGDRDCTLDQATTAYAPGGNADAACTLEFLRPSAAGWTVTGRTTWQGSWEGVDNDGPVGGALQTLSPTASIVVPVVQSQSVVTGVD